MGTSKFDDLLTQLGTGKWNFLYFFTNCYREFLIPAEAFSGIYLAPEVNYTCLPPEDLNITGISHDSCSYYVNKTTTNGEIASETVACTDWEFDTSIYTSTLTSEFKLVCDQAHYRATYQSISVWATLITASLIGYLADRYGRKTIAILMHLPYYILNICIAFATNFTVVLALRFTSGCFAISGMYVLALEVCELKNRSMVGIVMALPWAIGTMVYGGMAYLIRDWRYLHLSVSLPSIILLVIQFLLDESPRWLILKGYHARALNILRKASRWNKAQLPPDHKLKEMFLDIQQEHLMLKKKTVNSDSKQESRRITFYLPTLLRTPKVRLITVMFSINMFISSLVFNGLTLSGDTYYSADPFMYTVLTGLMEAPAYTLTAPIINRWGRKKPSIFCYIVSGITIFALAFIPSDWSWLMLTLALVGKLCASAAFMIIYVFLIELFPTEVRLRGSCTVIAMSVVGGASAPYITDLLGPIVPWFPAVLFGTTSFIASLTLLFFPETLGMPMKETIQELENQQQKQHSSHDLAEEEQNKLSEMSTTV